MIEKILRLGKEAAIYGLSSVLGRFLNFLLVPLYTNYLLKAEYGVIATLYSYVGFAAIIYGFGLDAAYMRYVSSMEIGDRKQNFSTPFVSHIATSLCLSLPLLVLADPLALAIGLEPGQSILVQYAAGILLFDTLAIIPFASLRMSNRAMTFATIKIFHILLTIALNLVLLLGLGMKAEGVLLANLGASAVAFVVLLRVVVPAFTLRFSVPLYRELLKFGLPYIPAGLAGIALQVIDRPILKALTDDATVGVYQANYRLGIFMMLVVGMFDYAWRPFFLAHANDPDAKSLFSRVFTYFCTLALGLFLLVSFFVDDLVRIQLFGRYFIHPDYWVGLSIVPWVLLAYIFNGAYLNFVIGVYLQKRTKFIPYVTGAGALVNIGVNLLLIPTLGMMGAAYATLAAYMVIAVGIYFASQRFYPIAYEWGKVVRLAIVSAGLFSLFLILHPVAGEFPDMLIKGALAVSFFVLAVVVRAVEPHELRETVSILKARTKRS